MVNYQNLIEYFSERDIKVVVQSTIQCEPLKCSVSTVEKINQLNERLAKTSNNQDVFF